MNEWYLRKFEGGCWTPPNHPLGTPLLAVILERPGVQGWALKAISSRGTVSWWGIIWYFFLQPYVALLRHSQSSSLRDKTSQHHLTSPEAAGVPNYYLLSFAWRLIINKDHKMKSMEVTLHICDQRRFFGKHNNVAYIHDHQKYCTLCYLNAECSLYTPIIWIFFH